VSVHHLDRSLHRCVILASDGVWNMVGALEAVKVVQYCVRQYERLALSRTLSSLDHSDASAVINDSLRMLCAELWLYFDETTMFHQKLKN